MRSLPRTILRTFVLLAVTTILPRCFAQASAPGEKSATDFPPLLQWKSAVISGNTAALKALYSTNPPAQVATATGQSDAESDVSFWAGLKARRIKLDVVQSDSPQAGTHQVVFQAEVLSASPGEHTVYVTVGQLWQQQDNHWRLAATKRNDPTRLQQPISKSKVIYAPGLDAHTEVKDAVALASREHKRVLVVFGANWCYDCHVLDLAFHRPDVEPVLQKYYEIVHVDVGEGDKNQDLMQQYQVPMKKGIPAIAVLDSDGKLLYSQQGGEFEKARALAPEDVLAFLNKWKPASH
jgi:thiol-disulfide isomerase/thioredoxin